MYTDSIACSIVRLLNDVGQWSRIVRGTSPKRPTLGCRMGPLHRLTMDLPFDATSAHRYVPVWTPLEKFWIYSGLTD
jgi:hypothetical protein